MSIDISRFSSDVELEVFLSDELMSLWATTSAANALNQGDFAFTLTQVLPDVLVLR